MHSYPQLLHFLQAKQPLSSPFFIAIDGYAGAGKSTLAQQLVADLVTAQCIGLDDFYQPLTQAQQIQWQQQAAQQAYFDTHTFCQQVLAPLRQGQTATWRPLDWLSQTHLPPRQLLAQGIIIVEGVFASHPHLMAYMDTSVMVTASQAVQTQRVLQRSQPMTTWWAHWQATENWFHQHQQTQQKVDWLIAGEPPIF